MSRILSAAEQAIFNQHSSQTPLTEDEIFNQFPKDAQYYLTSGNNSRLMDLKSLAEIAKKNNLEKREFFNVNLALTFVKSIADIEDVVLITGSTFIISEIAEL